MDLTVFLLVNDTGQRADLLKGFILTSGLHSKYTVRIRHLCLQNMPLAAVTVPHVFIDEHKVLWVDKGNLLSLDYFNQLLGSSKVWSGSKFESPSEYDQVKEIKLNTMGAKNMVEFGQPPLNFLSQLLSRVLNPIKGFGTKFEYDMQGKLG